MAKKSDYTKGKIYKIVSDNSDKVYYGSTTQKYLSTRLAGHKNNYKKHLAKQFRYVTSFEVLKDADVRIVLVESYPCADCNELMARERYYIENYDCVNKVIPGRTKKEYYWDNKEENNKTCAKYYQSHKEQIKSNVREYYLKNKDAICQRSKLYREKHKEILMAKKSKKLYCACGGKAGAGHFSRHTKSKLHINHVSQIDNMKRITESLQNNFLVMQQQYKTL
jgi:hypothetical protein